MSIENKNSNTNLEAEKAQDKLTEDERLFLSKAKDAAKFFKGIDKHKTIRVVSHLDADGISAAAILIKLLNRTNRRYSISIVQQLNEEKIKSLKKERYGVFVFTDIGSGQIRYIAEHLKDRKVLVLDHHKPEEDFLKWEVNNNLFQYNPHLANIDGNDNISGSGVVYLFAREVAKKNKDMAHIAIVGAIGDMQEDYGFKPLNNLILEAAIETQKMKVINGVRIFGAQTRPLYKLLQYSTDPYIPGVTGSESGAIDFLQKMGIDPKNEDGGWTKLIELDDNEMKKLVAGIIMLRMNGSVEDAQKIVGPVYLMRDEKKASPLRDSKEFSTLLNACGRLKMASLGIGTCLGDPLTKRKALNALKDYKKEIVGALKWYENNANNKRMVKNHEGFIIINSKEEIRSSIIGTMCSIISKSNKDEHLKFIMGLARNDDENTTKISMRTTLQNGVDLSDIIATICDGIDAEVGGHKHAAGALIKSDDEPKVIENAKKVLSKMAIEEKMEI